MTCGTITEVGPVLLVGGVIDRVILITVVVTCETDLVCHCVIAVKHLKCALSVCC